MIRSNMLVLSNQQLACGIHQLVLQADQQPGRVLPGQFVQIESIAKHSVLPRPISIANYDAATNQLTLVIQQKGEGTQAICALAPWQSLRILWPLGNGLELPAPGKQIWLVGGGLGLAPLYYAAAYWRQQGHLVRAFAGFRNKEMAYYLDELQPLCDLGLTVMTDNGTLGQQGYVHQAVKQALETHVPDVLFACGPPRALEALQNTVMDDLRFDAYASLEERMACGYGVCRVCVCKVKQGDSLLMKRVCTDGPVFPLRKVSWAD